MAKDPASLEDLANEFEGAPAPTAPTQSQQAGHTGTLVPGTPEADAYLAGDPDAQQAPVDEDIPFATDADLEADQVAWLEAEANAPEAPEGDVAVAQAGIDQALVANGAEEPAPLPANLVDLASRVQAGVPVAEPPAPAKPAKAKAAAKAPVQKDWGKTTFRRWGTTSRKTGAVIGMYNADHPEAVTPVEPVLYDGKALGKPVDVTKVKGEGRWVLVDRSHGTATRGGNMDKVYVGMFSPEDWCPRCAKIVAGEAAKLAVAPRANSKAAQAATAAPAAPAKAPAKPKAAPKAKGKPKAAGKAASKATATKGKPKATAKPGKGVSAADSAAVQGTTQAALEAHGQAVLAEVAADLQNDTPATSK